MSRSCVSSGRHIHDLSRDGATTQAELTSRNYQIIWSSGSGVDPEPKSEKSSISEGRTTLVRHPQMDDHLQIGRFGGSMSVQIPAYVAAAKVRDQEVSMIPIHPHVASTNAHGLQAYEASSFRLFGCAAHPSDPRQ
jgi:hypothetical protein